MTFALEAVTQLVVVGQHSSQLRGQLLSTTSAANGGRRSGHQRVDVVLEDLDADLLLQHVLFSSLIDANETGERGGDVNET